MAREAGLWKKIGGYIRPVFDSGVNILIIGINKYINFGSTSGESGYGIRDNDGNIEVKSSGGSWNAISAGGEANTGANVGDGDGQVFKEKVGSELRFKTIKAGANVTVTNNENDVTIASTIANNAVTYAKMQDVSATSRVLGRITAGAGDPEELTGADIRTIANVADGADVTSATNVGSSIHGADAKTTPVGADTIAMIDSEASNVLKKITFTNVASFFASLAQTLTNKRITKRVGSIESSATPTVNTDNVDQFYITALADNITSMTTNLSGTPTTGQILFIAITGTATRTISWGASFEDGPTALPTTTDGTKRLDVLFIWNAVTEKWRCMSAGSTV